MRTILHCDCNSFYASVEIAKDPARLAGKALAVCGDPEMRHGIILAKSHEAKLFGVRTGETIWSARRKCPHLLLLPANFPDYLAASRRFKVLCERFTPLVEPFGLDENWLDITGCRYDGEKAAVMLRKTVREELGIGVSVGISFNKVFAKLGSDLRKPDASTVISPDNFREKIWPLPVGHILYAGPSTVKSLKSIGVHTIGDLAACDAALLKTHLGKHGEMLKSYANGMDDAPVLPVNEQEDIKSIGNSTTPPRDIADIHEAAVLLSALCEGVAARMRRKRMACQTVTVSGRDTDLVWFSRQKKLSRPIDSPDKIAETALALLAASYTWEKPLRSLGVTGGDLSSTRDNVQVSFSSAAKARKMSVLSETVGALREKFGYTCIGRGILREAPYTARFNPLEIHERQPFAGMSRT